MPTLTRNRRPYHLLTQVRRQAGTPGRYERLHVSVEVYGAGPGR